MYIFLLHYTYVKASYSEKMIAILETLNRIHFSPKILYHSFYGISYFILHSFAKDVMTVPHVINKSHANLEGVLIF